MRRIDSRLKINHLFRRVLAVWALLAAANVYSNEAPSERSQADYSQHPKAQAIIEQLVSEHHFKPQQVIDILRLAKTEQRILDSMANAAEKTKTWTVYKNNFIVPHRIEQGGIFYKRYAKVLADAEKKYGVPAHIITAILGIETNYGGYTGKANVLNALATLAFEHPRRGKFFQSELVEYIVLCKEQNWPAATTSGSYAGAMGMAQFMPSNYRRLAVDGNEDGVVNLFDPIDAIYSVANYLSHHGWHAQQMIVLPATMNASFDEKIVGRGLKPNHTRLALEQAGVEVANNVAVNISSQTKMRAIRFNDTDGDELWLGLQNFYVISRYNPRAKYAMVVYLLGEAILQQASSEPLDKHIK